MLSMLREGAYNVRGYLAAVLGVTLMTAIIGLILHQFRIANTSMLYLVVVLAVAAKYGSLSAILASVLAFLAFDWFFVQPTWSLTIRDPDEWLALMLFLATAIVTGQLAALQRYEARVARAREREATLLYEVVRIIEEDELVVALQRVSERLQAELNMDGVSIELAGEGDGPIKAFSGSLQAKQAVMSMATVSRYVLDDKSLDGERAGHTTWVRVSGSRPKRASATLYTVPVMIGRGRAGDIVLVCCNRKQPLPTEETRLLSVVAQQIGRAVERRRLQRSANETEVLRRTDELKTALMNAVSHDLKTPLATISAAAESLLQQDVQWTPLDRYEFAQDIAQESHRLGRLVDNLLDLSRIEGGNLRPHKTWCDIGSLVEEVCGRLKGMLAGRDITLAVEEGLPPLLIDYVEIGQVLSNLLENAHRYTPPNAPIEVHVYRVGDEVWVEVADRGPGIPPQALDRIFEKFYRIESKGTRAHGTGLGLAVAKGMIEAHGGKIWASNRASGGAVFTFTIPIPDGGEVVAHELQWS